MTLYQQVCLHAGAWDVAHMLQSCLDFAGFYASQLAERAGLLCAAQYELGNGQEVLPARCFRNETLLSRDTAARCADLSSGGAGTNQ